MAHGLCPRGNNQNRAWRAARRSLWLMRQRQRRDLDILSTRVFVGNVSVPVENIFCIIVNLRGERGFFYISFSFRCLSGRNFLTCLSSACVEKPSHTLEMKTLPSHLSWAVACGKTINMITVANEWPGHKIKMSKENVLAHCLVLINNCK